MQYYSINSTLWITYITEPTGMQHWYRIAPTAPPLAAAPWIWTVTAVIFQGQGSNETRPATKQTGKAVQQFANIACLLWCHIYTTDIIVHTMEGGLLGLQRTAKAGTVGYLWKTPWAHCTRYPMSHAGPQLAPDGLNCNEH